ncbi:MAG: hypothetical protein GQ547_03605 [Methylophaga sp.]|nr:hypothetical protein [Methylophaga sp.]
MLKDFLNFGKAKTVLVCETDGFLLRGAVLTRSGNELVVLHHAQSQQADMADAVADVINTVKAAGWDGDEAILLSPTVLSTLIELPVNPKKPRPLLQMQELIRWEAEPLLMQHTTQWSVGNLLVGRGYMTEEQAEAVMDLQQGKANPAGGLALSEKFSLRRFGDLAGELGYIKRSQLNACLAGQEWLKSDDDEIECGWSPQAEVSDVPGTYGWLVTCVNKGLLKRWISVFDKHGVALQSMYSLAGSSACLLPASSGSSVLLESHQGLSFSMQVLDNKVIAQHLFLSPAKQPLESCLETYHALNPDSADPVSLASWHKESAALTDELSQSLSGELSLLNHSAISEHLSPGMLGAGYHAFALLSSQLCAGARLGGPLPSKWQRVETRAIILVLFMLLSIIVSEASLFIRSSQIETHKADVDSQWEMINGAMKRIKGDIKQVEQRKKLIKENEVDHRRTEAKLAFFGDLVPERVALVQAVLGILQSAVGDDVIINSIDEYGKRVGVMPPLPNSKKDNRKEVENFNLEAWALTETAAQTFIQQMKDAIAPWGMEVRESHVLARTGPMSLEGFAVSMRLVKLMSPEAIKQQQGQ